MTALVVVAHPDPASLTHAVAHTVGTALERRGVEVRQADLAAEGFDPRFSLDDRRRYTEDGPIPPDVVAEQRRLDEVDDLVLVFPVYWWSMPATLKGWIDRVFIRGWAFDDRVSPFRRMLGDLTIHLVMLGGEDADGFRRRAYDTAMSTQIETGVLGYCGARRGVIATVYESETAGADATTARARAISESIADRAHSEVTDATAC